MIKLIIGLGNPGSDYSQTRHNAGFWWLDRLAAKTAFRMEGRFHGEVAKISVAGQELWLLKPHTFMNNSGRAAQAMAAFYKIVPEECLVVHDELDLPAGTTRLKKSGGHGGHNGLRSLHSVFGEHYYRLRVGIGHPGDKSLVLNYVLSRANRADELAIQDSFISADAALETWLKHGFDKAVQALHTPPPSK